MKIIFTFVILASSMCSCILNRHNEVLVPLQTVSYGIPMPEKTARLNDSLKNRILSFERLNPKSTLGAKVSIKSIAIEEMCDSLYDLIEAIQVYVVEFEGVQSYDDYLQSGLLTNHRDFSPGNCLLTTSKPHVRALADSLQTRINYTRNRMIGLFKGLPNVDEQLGSMLNLRADDQPDYYDSEKRLWTRNIFHDMPKGAVIALMKKLQNDLLNSKLEVYSQLLRILETSE